MDDHALHTHLAQFTGSETFTRHHLLSHMCMTEGATWLANHAGAHWLTDVIASYQHVPHVNSEHFQVWRLVVDDRTQAGVIIMADGHSDQPRVQQEFAYTDFPLSEITLWLVAQGDHLVLMLPSEY